MKNFRKIFAISAVLFGGAFTSLAQQARSAQPNVIMHLPPIAEFSFLNLCFGDTAKFINQSTLAGSYFWTIYDSGSNIIDTSSSQDISFYFPTPGIYTVSLDANNGHIANITKVVTIGNTTLADFSFLRCANNFNNMSACANSFLWDFGDGTTSTANLPIHQYADTGRYQVSLVACNGLICDTVKKQILVDGLGNPDDSFTLSQSADTLFYQMNNFMPYETITWYFGDGTSSVLTTPQSYHVYQDTGNFSVSVQVINACGMRFSASYIHMSFPLSGISLNTALNSTIGIYPNPSHEILTIETTLNCIEKLTLFDLSGNCISEIQNRTPQKINTIRVSELASGTYHLRLVTKQGVVNKKILKE